MDRQITIFVDMDDVVANLVPQLISLYNDDYEDNLLVDEITEWDLTKFVKSECGKKIYNYLDAPMLYYDVKPVEGAKEGIAFFRALGARIVYATMISVVDACRLTGKYNWLVAHSFLDADRPQDLVGIKDKSLLRGAILIDDFAENLDGFSGETILFDRPWNHNALRLQRAHGWVDVVNIAEYYLTC